MVKTRAVQNEDYNPKMEVWKAVIRFFGRTLDGVAKQGVSVSLSVLGCIVFFSLFQQARAEMKEQILEVKKEWSETLSKERAAAARAAEQAKGDIEHCNHERERLAVRVAGLEVIVEQLKRKRQ